MKIEEKSEIVKTLHEKFSRAKVVFVTDYKGLDVATITHLRRKLRESGIEYRVVKNTLLVRASEDTEVSVIKDKFKGPTAVALSYNDPVNAAKILTNFAKDYEKLQIIAGALEGRVLDLKAIKNLATLPSREVLLSQLLSTMNGVPTSFLRVLNAISQRFLFVLNAIKEKKAAS